MSRREQPIRVAVVGAGERGVYVLGARAVELREETGIVIRLLCDTNEERAAEAKRYLEDLYSKSGAEVKIASEPDYSKAIDGVDIVAGCVTNYTS